MDDAQRHYRVEHVLRLLQPDPDRRPELAVRQGQWYRQYNARLSETRNVGRIPMGCVQRHDIGLRFLPMLRSENARPVRLEHGEGDRHDRHVRARFEPHPAGCVRLEYGKGHHVRRHVRRVRGPHPAGCVRLEYGKGHRVQRHVQRVQKPHPAGCVRLGYEERDRHVWHVPKLLPSRSAGCIRLEYAERDQHV